YATARQQHGESELLDEVVSSKPKMERTSYRTPEELREGCLQQIRDAIGVLDGSATPEEIDDYKRFIMHLAHDVAAAHREGGQEADAAVGQRVSTSRGGWRSCPHPTYGVGRSPRRSGSRSGPLLGVRPRQPRRR